VKRSLALGPVAEQQQVLVFWGPITVIPVVRDREIRVRRVIRVTREGSQVSVIRIILVVRGRVIVSSGLGSYPHWKHMVKSHQP
jgi:hypothetical protein